MAARKKGMAYRTDGQSIFARPPAVGAVSVLFIAETLPPEVRRGRDLRVYTILGHRTYETMYTVV